MIEQIMAEAEEIAVEQVETYGRHVKRLRTCPVTAAQQRMVKRLGGYLAKAKTSLATIRMEREGLRG